MKRYASYGTGLAAIAAASFAWMAFAAVPQTISYQSRLRDSGGVAVTTATNVSFSLYSAASGGSPLWTETYDQASGACKKITPDADGYFSLRLASCAAFPGTLKFGDPVFLGVTIGSDAEATPRVQFSPAPYALNALRVGPLTGDLASNTVTVSGTASFADTITPAPSCRRGTTCTTWALTRTVSVWATSKTWSSATPSTTARP